MSLTPEQIEAIGQVFRWTAGTAMAGGALRGGVELGRLVNPGNTYKAPEVADPIVVDIPRPTPDLTKAIPADRKIKELPATKAADDHPLNFLKKIPFGIGERVFNNLPTLGSLTEAPAGQPGATIPLQAAALGAALPAAGVGGYLLTDRLMRAAERRRAQSDLDDAQKEYREATLGKAKTLQFPKLAACLLDGFPTLDPTVRRVKLALENAFTAIKKAESVQAASAEPVTDKVNPWAFGGAMPNPMMSPMPAPSPAPLPMTTVRGGGGIGGIGTPSQPPPFSASTTIPNAQVRTDGVGPVSPEVSIKVSGEGDVGDYAAKATSNFLWPGLLTQQMTPRFAAINLGLAGGAAGLGGYLGWRRARDNDEARANNDQLKKKIKEMDEANATAIQPPMIARLVPTPA